MPHSPESRRCKGKPSIALISLYIFENNGIRYLASSLRQKNYRVAEIYFKDYVHHNFKPPTEREIELLLQTLHRENVDIIGLSVRAGGYYRLASRLTAVLKANFEVPVIWGGMHVTMDPENSLAACDGVMIGESEATICELMEALEKNRPFTDIKGFWYKDKDGRIIRNPLRPLQENLDELPFRDFHSHEYKYSIDGNTLRRGGPYSDQTGYLMMSARGCLFNCAYCDVSALRKVYGGLGKFYRTCSPQRVIEECLYARRHFPKLRRFRFDDELFCMDDAYLEEFCRLYREKVNLPFELLTDPRVVKAGRLQKLKQAGLDTVMMGIQNIGRVNAKYYNRHVSDEQVIAAAEAIHEIGIKPCYQILLDDPHVDEQDNRELFELLLKLPRPYDLYLFSLSYWPKTDITERYIADGSIGPEDVEGQNDKCLKQFRVDLTWPRDKNRTFWYSLYTLLSKPVPVCIVKALSRCRWLRSHPEPVRILAQLLNFLKLAELAWQMLLRGELTRSTIKRWVNLDSLAVS